MSDFEVENLSATGVSEPDLLETDGEDKMQGQESSESRKGDVRRKWKEMREAEIAARDKADRQAKEKLQEAAIKHIDDFYENYNRKKAQQLEEVKREADEFLRKKQEFFSQENTTTWDRALQLINEDDADILGNRDRSKFKEILQKLKGNPQAPGA
ncbi:hypothetical protein HG537_0E04770 [Torulaspora globosa]|uniref:Clathrin light chain n=1 Tax=Torulaspora globosa TaxID=48254 RepID=A0A7H9HXI6_9SACH|nr:hypothetical protein HG537_0E04770 [Torulaspora sp. CBS 2947]